MTLQLVYAAVGGDLEQKIRELEKPIAKAATAAVKDADALVKKESKSALASAGFSGRSQNAMKSVMTPKTGDSINVSVDFFLRPAYLNIFETGAQISGKPLLWLPLDTVPLGAGGKRLTPKQYVDRIGPLHSARGAKTPLLVGKGSRSQILRATSKAVRFRKRAGLQQGTVNVPLFVGVPAVNIRKKFDLAGIVASARSQLGALYLKNIKAISGG